MSAELKCASCGCDNVEEVKEVVEVQQEHEGHEDTHFAVLLALVPAMSMSLFNMMGIL